MNPTLYRIALHESAHCLAALKYGVPIQYVWVDSQQGGGVQFEQDILRDYPQAEMMVSAAGREAEALFLSPTGAESHAHRDDFSRAHRAATNYSRASGDPTDRAGLDMLNVMRRQAQRFVADNAPTIQALANELMARGRMTGPELAAWLTGG